jgi:hypothetical protein
MGARIKLAGKVGSSGASHAGQVISVQFYKKQTNGRYKLVYTQNAKVLSNQTYSLTRTKFSRGQWQVKATIKATAKTNAKTSVAQYLSVR